jgi:4-hydroxy-tetrahydrodipicolinate synthase
MQIQLKLLPLHKNLFIEANPIPVKWAMARMKLCGPTLRLPMTQLEPANETTVENALRVCGLI